ncbi:DUF58 domain-containing protein [Acinetobacter sp. c3-l95]|uniref:DUF58 domain-containing protein n=1 Tax=Acinetobacter sp. c3-l95 TaxID=3342804 RepID=UPI0035B96E34
MNFFKNKIDHWFKKRLTVADQKTLQQNDVFVFISREGILFVLLLVCTFIAGINYGNNLILGLCFLCVSLLLLSFYLAFKQLYGLTIQLKLPELGQVGHALDLKFHFKPKAKQMHLHLRCEYLGQAKKISTLNQAIDVLFTDLPQQRGLYVLPRFYFYSVYPFAIVRAWSYIYPKYQIWIAPQPRSVDLYKYGLNNNQQKQGMEDFSHLREYHSGDPLNRVAWQQYAKGRGLLVKQFEQFEQNQVHLKYQDMPSNGHEDKLSELMFLVEQCQSQNRAFSLTLPSRTLAYAQGNDHIYQAKLLLAQEP